MNILHKLTRKEKKSSSIIEKERESALKFLIYNDRLFFG